MYSHKIIDDVDKFLKPLRNKKELNLYIKKWMRIRLLIKESQKFHVGDYDNFQEPFKKGFKKDLLFYENVSYLKLPYNVTYVDYFFSRKKSNPPGTMWTPKQACLAIEEKINYWRVYQFSFDGDKIRWVFNPFEFHIGVGVPLHEVCDLFSIGDGIGNIWCYPLIDTINGNQLDFINDGRTGMQSVEFLTTLLNCKNIEKEKIYPSLSLNKKRSQNMKTEIFSYHILKIVVPVQKKSTCSNDESGFTKRIHLCRGHFKEYTAENPLFGKYTGLYWWQPHVRGRNKKGMVLKDYNVTPQDVEWENPDP